ncbi:MAG TPA: hypothetical protein VK932_11920 [Kofleriaceae bacterium]|nr:hypothetical protein [Kofleriaceae bacterium]
MAASPPIEDPAAREPGAPVPRDAIDPELVKLARTRPKIGAITAAAVVVLCGWFMFRLGADRRFGGEPESPRAVALADVAAGKVADESFVSFEAEPMMSHAIRTGRTKSDPGLRVTPVRGTGERVWLVLSGDGWERPTLKAYTGRLRRIGELPFAGVLDAHATAYPRPTFASAASVRAAFAGGPVTTVAGDKIAVADTDRVAFDVVDPGRATIVATFTGKRDPAEGDPGHGPLTDAALWIAELGKHGVAATVSSTPGQADAVLGQARLDVAMPVADVTAKLEAAKLWAARVERVTRHHETTWGALRASPAGAFAAGGGQPVPDAHVDLVGLHVQRGVPGDALALLVGEKPADYWYVLPLTVVLGIIGLLFAWALVRVIRDLLPARVPVTTTR